MHTQNSSDRQLSSVKELLIELDGMKERGLGAQQRIDLILKKGEDFADELNVQDAFELEQASQAKRIKQLELLANNLEAYRTQWKDAPVKKGVKEAATKLLEILRGFITTAQREERKAESEMLSTLWTWAPDVTDQWPWLAAPPKKLEKNPELEEVKELETKKSSGGKLDPELTEKELEAHQKVVEKIEENVKELAVKTNTEPDQLLESVRTLGDAVEKEAKKQSRTAKVKEKVSSAPDLFAGGFEVEDSGEIEVSSVKERLSPKKETHEVTSDLMRDAWTEALQEMTTHSWEFVKELSGLRDTTYAKVWKWEAGEDTAELEIRDRKSGDLSKGQVRHPGTLKIVTLSLRLLGSYKRHQEIMTDAEIEKMHLDPIPFIEKIRTVLPAGPSAGA